MPMSPVPPSPAIASTVISPSRPVARSPAASPAAAAAVDGNATLTHGTSTEAVGYMPPSTVRQLAGHGHDHVAVERLGDRAQADADPAAGAGTVAGQNELGGGKIDDAGHFAPPVSLRLTQSVGRCRTPACPSARARSAASASCSGETSRPPRPQTAPQTTGAPGSP